MCPNLPRNPYIVGRPVQMPDELFGRAILLRTIADSLQQDAQFILLHGQRRIGKSSVLRNIPRFVSPDEFVFVSCDLEDRGDASLGEILYAIATEIFQHLNLDNDTLNPLLNIDSDLKKIRKFFNTIVLPPLYKKLDNKKLVLLLDEFDVVTQNDTEQAIEFLRFLENLVRQQEELFVIAVVGRYLNAMPNLIQSFRGAPFYEIGLLDINDAQRLIIQPNSNNILEYQPKAITEVLNVSSGHPFCTQVLCHEIFKLVKRENNFTSPAVVPDYVGEVIPHALESAEGGLDSICKGLSIAEKVVISAVAEAQKYNTIENPLKLLEAYGLVLTNSLEEAIQLLINKGFLDSNPVKVKIELVRLWLLKRHPLKDEIKNLEALEQENVNQILGVARNCWQEGKQENALNLYEEILQLNPNHFSTIVELAEKYLEVKNFDKALKLYARVYKLDRVGYKEEFIEALNQYGHWLITEKKYTVAKQQYEKILQIQPGNSLAQQRIAEIKAYQYGKTSNNINFVKIKQALTSPILVIILVSIGGAGILIFGNLILKVCPVGQEKSLGIFCTNSIKISRGDRTLFPETQNSDRDNGIKSFKAGQYKVAANYFAEAVKNNPNDPEVLIYQNNALAHQRGNPLTLAAVVPITNRRNSAQEILRGIAQAQNKFNNQQRKLKKSSLLEIVIVDDEDDINTAKQVAEELVKNKLILGVIGHGSSHVTDAALPTYTLAKLAVISPTSSSTQIHSPVFFRTVNSNKVTGKNLADYAWKLQLKKVVIFCNPNDPYSNTMREEFRVAFMANAGAEIVGGGQTCIHNLAAPTFDAGLEMQNIVLDQNPAQAIVLFPNTRHLENAGIVAKAHKDLINKLQQTVSNIQKLKLLGGDVLYNDEFLNKYSDALEGLVLSVPWFREAPESTKFAEEARKQWGGDVSWRTATSFDATQAFIDSFKGSLTISREVVLKNLPNISLSSNNTSTSVKDLEEVKFDSISREIKRKETLVILKKNGKLSVIAK